MKTHDFRTGRWAHAIGMSYEEPDGPNGEYRVRWIGHGLGLKVGDIILRNMQSGKVGKFRIYECEYKKDPRDMFVIKVEFADYATEKEIAEAVQESRPKEELNPKFSG